MKNGCHSKAYSLPLIQHLNRKLTLPPFECYPFLFNKKGKIAVPQGD